MQSRQDPHRVMRLSYRVMDGLKDAILEQIDPNRKREQETWLQKAQRKADREKSEQERLLDEISRD